MNKWINKYINKYIYICVCVCICIHVHMHVCVNLSDICTLMWLHWSLPIHAYNLQYALPKIRGGSGRVWEFRCRGAMYPWAAVVPKGCYVGCPTSVVSTLSVSYHYLLWLQGSVILVNPSGEVSATSVTVCIHVYIYIHSCAVCIYMCKYICIYATHLPKKWLETS